MKLFSRSFWLVVGLLLIAEILVRFLRPQDVSGRFSYGYDAGPGFVESAGRVDLVRAGGRRFRPQSFAMPKPAGTCRIFVVGDSVPRGPSLEGAYPHQLQELLRAEGVDAEVLNLGVAGYGVRRCQIVLRQVLKYQPDLVICHLNDSNEYEDEREWRRSREFNSWHPRHWPMKLFIFRRLYELKTEKVFWELLPQEVRQKTSANDADAEVAAMQDRAQQVEWRRRVETVVGEDVALARAAGTPVLLVAQTRFAKTAGTLDSGYLGDLANSFIGQGVATVDMRPVLVGCEPAKLFADSAHMNADGHRLLAAAIRAVIRQKELLPQRQKTGPPHPVTNK